jgi:NADP-dependent 3-hydroxy acid dehydrogenase YdfG
MRQSNFLTGAASGIGKATVERLIKDGSLVFAADIAEAALNNAYSSIDSKYVKTIKLDVSNADEVAR